MRQLHPHPHPEQGDIQPTHFRTSIPPIETNNSFVPSLKALLLQLLLPLQQLELVNLLQQLLLLLNSLLLLLLLLILLHVLLLLLQLPPPLQDYASPPPDLWAAGGLGLCPPSCL